MFLPIQIFKKTENKVETRKNFCIKKWKQETKLENIFSNWTGSKISN